MQALLVVAKSDKGSAEKLEPSELSSNIRLGESILRDGSKLYEGCEPWVAYYVLTCASVMKLKGFEPGVVQQELLKHRPDNEYKPRWHERFIKKHRGYLVMLGWIRHFNDREATGNSLEPHELQSPISLMKTAEGPADCKCRFELLDSRLNELGFPEAERPYSEFTELPAAYELHP
jgi:hypothetical protein